MGKMGKGFKDGGKGEGLRVGKRGGVKMLKG